MNHEPLNGVEMQLVNRYRIATGALQGAWILLLCLPCIALRAQGQQRSTTVPLSSDVCPVVHAGDRIAFEWNPAFQAGEAVLGLSGIELRFARVDDDGVHLIPRAQIALGGRLMPQIATAQLQPNGAYALELPLLIDRKTTPGTYRLMEAALHARVSGESGGSIPEATSSPVDGRFCFTLQGAQ